MHEVSALYRAGQDLALSSMYIRRPLTLWLPNVLACGVNLIGTSALVGSRQTHRKGRADGG